MPAPIKWTADFELINSESPEGEPWLAATPDGRFNLTFFESFPTASPAYTDIETRLYSAAGLDTGLGPAPTFSATTTDHQAATAYFPDGRNVYVWTEEPNAGGGNQEDVYASIYVGQLVIVPRFLVSGGAGIQHDPVVAASAAGFVVALADDSVAGGQLILKFYNAAGGLITTVTDADDPEGVNTPGGSEDDYRDVEVTVLTNNNYVVTWTDDTSFDIWARVYSPTGVAQTGLIEIEPGGGVATFPDVTALADGRFLVTYEQYSINTVRGRIYEANGTPSAGPFTITTDAANALNQQVQSAALQDGRFVTVWRNVAGNIEGQMMFANGTPDGAAFAVNSDGTGNKGRPTVAALADGRFAVSWESGAGATATIFTTIFDPREQGINIAGTSGADDYFGSGFADIISQGGGNDRVDGAGGDDALYGGAGNDALFGGAGNDTMDGGGDADAMVGGTGNDTMSGGVGNDTLLMDDSTAPAATIGNDTGNGDAGNDLLWGYGGNDTLNGGAGNDAIVGNDFSVAVAGTDGLYGGAGDDTLFVGAGGNAYMDGGTGADIFYGGLLADILRGGTGNDYLYGNTGGDFFQFYQADFANGNSDIVYFVDGTDRLQFSASLNGDLFFQNLASLEYAPGQFTTGVYITAFLGGGQTATITVYGTTVASLTPMVEYTL